MKQDNNHLICSRFQHSGADRRTSQPPPVPPYPDEFTHGQYDNFDIEAQNDFEEELDQNDEFDDSESDEKESDDEKDGKNEITRDEVPYVFSDTKLW